MRRRDLLRGGLATVALCAAPALLPAAALESDHLLDQIWGDMVSSAPTAALPRPPTAAYLPRFQPDVLSLTARQYEVLLAAVGRPGCTPTILQSFLDQAPTNTLPDSAAG